MWARCDEGIDLLVVCLKKSDPTIFLNKYDDQVELQ